MRLRRSGRSARDPVPEDRRAEEAEHRRRPDARRERGQCRHECEERRSAHVPRVGEQPPDPEELRASGGRRQVCAERHHDARADPVAEADEQRDQEQPHGVVREGQQGEGGAHDEHARHRDPAAALDVHDLAGRVENQHVDGSGEPVDQGGRGGVQPDVLRPQGQHRLAGGAHRGDEQHPDAHGDEDARVAAHDRPHGRRQGRYRTIRDRPAPARRAAGGLEFGDPPAQGGGDQAGGTPTQ